jgi:serine/threonine-protein phosphatase 5
MRVNGYEVEQGGLLVTIFSAPNYCDQMGNKGAFLLFDSQSKYTPVTFSHVPHPSIPVMAYNRFKGMV